MRTLLRLIVLSTILHVPHLYPADSSYDHEPPIVKQVDGLIVTLDRRTNTLVLEHTECHPVKLKFGNRPLCMDVIEKPYVVVIGYADGSIRLIKSSPPPFLENDGSMPHHIIQTIARQLMHTPIHEINIADDHDILTMRTCGTSKIVSLELLFIPPEAKWGLVEIPIPDKESTL